MGYKCPEINEGGKITHFFKKWRGEGGLGPPGESSRFKPFVDMAKIIGALEKNGGAL